MSVINLKSICKVSDVKKKDFCFIVTFYILQLQTWYPSWNAHPSMKPVSLAAHSHMQNYSLLIFLSIPKISGLGYGPKRFCSVAKIIHVVTFEFF